MIEKYERDLPTLTIDDLETLIDMFQTELQVRKDEREKVMRQYQDELDRLLDAIKGDGFHTEWDAYCNIPVVVEDED